MSGSFESVPWNACMHRLDLGLCSLLKEFWGNGVKTHVNSKGKIPSTGKKFSQRRIEPKTLHVFSTEVPPAMQVGVVVACLLKVPATCWCILGSDLLKQL